jgi:hypothetical protein
LQGIEVFIKSPFLESLLVILSHLGVIGISHGRRTSAKS